VTKLYANENFPQPVVDSLRALGHDVLTTLDSGKAGQKIPDEEVLRFSIAEGRILVTLNRRHFIDLHKKDDSHKGIIVCTFDTDFNALAERIHMKLQEVADMTGKLERVNRPNPPKSQSK
jgi:hypothetical protein